MITCPACKKENSASHKFCLSCGADLAAASVERICVGCGLLVPEGFAFCGKCGTRYDAPVRAAPVPAPATTSIKAMLVLIRPDGGEGGSFPLQSGENIIGRSSGELFVSDAYLSPKHAVIDIKDKNNVFFRDNDSLNGSYYRLSEKVALQNEDIFRIGQELILFEYMRPAEAAATQEPRTQGSPDPGYWGRIALIAGPESIGNAFPLAEDDVVLGRERAAILFPDDGFVSSTHARLQYADGKAWLSDLGSSNGTFLRLREPRKLRSQDQILLGQQLFRIEF